MGERALRLLAVNDEIRVEAGKSPLDPMGLGVRYAEMVMIRREVGLLTEGQRGKLGE